MNYQHVTHPAADLARDAKALAKSVYALNADHFCTDLDAVEVPCEYFPDRHTIIPFAAIDGLVSATNREVEALRRGGHFPHVGKMVELGAEDSGRSKT